jgi:hypothetical protein
MVEAARFYQLAADRGSKDAMMSLGLFHWCGLGGLAANQDEARRYWEMAGFDLNGPFTPGSDLSHDGDSVLFSVQNLGIAARRTIAIDCNRSEARVGIDERDSIDCVRALSISDEESRVAESDLSEQEFGPDAEEDRSVSDDRTERFQSVKVETEFEFTPSFELWNADRLRSIESVVLFDGHHSVRELLLSSPPPSVSQLSLLLGEGIVREGNRCLHSSLDSSNGMIMFDELKGCCDIRSLLRLCVNFYTRATFLYRCVNQFMRETSNRDEETGRNVGIYIGIVRECFCVRSDLNPLSWSIPAKLYRGAKFPVGVVVDYARRQTEQIWWQGFTSASSDIKQARKFEGNVVFEIVLTDSSPSLCECSAFPQEQEFILNPYQQFRLEEVRWNNSLGRWIIQVGGLPSPDPVSWFLTPEATVVSSVAPAEDIDH